MYRHWVILQVVLVSPRVLATKRGKLIDHTRKVMSRREDMSCNVMGSNSVARNIFFSYVICTFLIILLWNLHSNEWVLHNCLMCLCGKKLFLKTRRF